ncbi:hypothetical protein [Streptomyces heilongjiangensis]|uniref:Uncharacterized protein n=1 Tax=Streptomyces heilongjiangensis TaxID=945052 RepID=A0ABW1B0R6_9ACTN|nr:hypothetical protein [Streptomyces heilongjiangensis]MDC2951269.1 hypothetical protein [Streptomyces heilongjiangensis]
MTVTRVTTVRGGGRGWCGDAAALVDGWRWWTAGTGGRLALVDGCL